MSRHDTVARWLDTVPQNKKKQDSSNNVWVCCPFHGGGNEKTPSLKINTANKSIAAGAFHCFGCGKHGNWNIIAKALKLPTFNYGDEDDGVWATPLDDTVSDSVLGESHSVSKENIIGDWSGEDWRKISGKLLVKLKSKVVLDEDYETNRLYLPVNILGDEVGGIKACLTGQSKMKYINTPGHWKKTALFPYDYITTRLQETGLKYVVICEGPRDALNLIQHGVPALATIGASVPYNKDTKRFDKDWYKSMAKLLAFLDIDTVVTAFDPDSVGKIASLRWRKAAKQMGFKVKNIKFPDIKMEDKSDKIDPGSLTSKQVKTLKLKLER